MRKMLLFSLLTMLLLGVQAQSVDLRTLIAQGNELHDLGQYDKALEKYREALKLDQHSAQVYYEMSYTYLQMKQYDLAVENSKRAVDEKGGVDEQAYLIWGTALDMQGNSKEAIKVYGKGIKEFPTSNLLHYNLGLTAHNASQPELAEKATFEAMRAKPSHGSAQLLMLEIQSTSKQRVKSLLPLYFFLMIEPQSDRSQKQYLRLRNLLMRGVNRKDEKTININILTMDKNDPFASVEMLLSLSAASVYTEKKENLSEIEQFVELTTNFIESLPSQKESSKTANWNFYIDKFKALAQNHDRLTCFCYFISQSAISDEVNQWLSKHPNDVQELETWITENIKK